MHYAIIRKSNYPHYEQKSLMFKYDIDDYYIVGFKIVLTILHITKAGLSWCLKLNIAIPKYANTQVSINNNYRQTINNKANIFKNVNISIPMDLQTVEPPNE